MLLFEIKKSGAILGSDILDHHVPSSFCPEETGSMVKYCHVRERALLEFVSGLSDLKMLWRNSKEWIEKTGNLFQILLHISSVAKCKHLGPVFLKSSIRYLTN